MSGGDKILSENYFQHADHFTRVLNEQDINKKLKFSQDNQDNTANLVQPENNDKKDQKILEDNKEVPH